MGITENECVDQLQGDKYQAINSYNFHKCSNAIQLENNNIFKYVAGEMKVYFQINDILIPLHMIPVITFYYFLLNVLL